MSEVISILDQCTWREINLAKRQLHWYKTKAPRGVLDFTDAINNEEQIIRSFFNSLSKDQAA